MKKAISIILAFLTALSTQTVCFAGETITEEQLEYALKYELSEISETFIESAKKNEIDVIALASIAALESGWGTSELSESKNNLFGWRKDSGEYKHFESLEDCVLYVSEKISSNYKMKEKEDLQKMANKYSEAENWGVAVTQIYEQIEQRCKEYEAIEKFKKQFEIRNKGVNM